MARDWGAGFGMAKGAGKKLGGKAAEVPAGARGYVHADKTMVARPEVGRGAVQEEGGVDQLPL